MLPCLNISSKEIDQWLWAQCHASHQKCICIQLEESGQASNIHVMLALAVREACVSVFPFLPGEVEDAERADDGEVRKLCLACLLA